MKLGVYSVFKNEAHYMERWLRAILPELKEGDSVTLVDTGSTDDYGVAIYAAMGLDKQDWPDILKSWSGPVIRGGMPTSMLDDKSPRPSLGDVNLWRISISPWRFDDARNAALALVPGDMDAAWSLDLDEFPQPGWRQALEDAYIEGKAFYRYKFIWGFNPDGSPGTTFYAQKLHRRYGFRWKGIAHEALTSESPSDLSHESSVFIPELEVHHHQDHTKERRGRDTSLMERTIKELPDDPRFQHYWARELMWNGRMPEASEMFQKHLANPQATWRPERAQSMIYLAKLGGNLQWNFQWLQRAIAEAPERKEVWYEMAKWYERKYLDSQGYWEEDRLLAIAYAHKAISAPPEKFYLSDPEAQGDGPRLLIERLQHERSTGAVQVRSGAAVEPGDITQATGSDSSIDTTV